MFGELAIRVGVTAIVQARLVIAPVTEFSLVCISIKFGDTFNTLGVEVRLGSSTSTDVLDLTTLLASFRRSLFLAMFDRRLIMVGNEGALA